MNLSLFFGRFSRVDDRWLDRNHNRRGTRYVSGWEVSRLSYLVEEVLFWLLELLDLGDEREALL